MDILYNKKFDVDFGNVLMASNKFLYCPDCNHAVQYDDVRGKKYQFQGYRVFQFTCPKCHKKHWVKQDTSWYITPDKKYPKTSKKFNNVELLELQAARNWAQTKTHEMIVHDAESGKLSIFLRFLNPIPTANGILWEPYYDKYIFNYKTHMSYIVWGKTYSGKMAWGNKGHAPLINQTSRHLGIWNGDVRFSCMSYELLTVLVREYCKCINVPIAEQILQQTQDDVTSKATMYAAINTLNRYPNIFVQFDEFKQSYMVKSLNAKPFISKSFAKEFPKTITDYHTWVKSTVSRYKLPKSKRFWKLYLQDVKYLDRAIWLRNCGFTNNDAMFNILTKVDTSSLFGFESSWDSPFTVKDKVRQYNKFRAILRRMLKVSKESVVANKFLQMNHYQLYDTCDMYEQVKRHDKKLLECVDWTGSMVEIHDDLSRIATKIEHENCEIGYSKKERALEQRVGDYVFALAKDTNELVAIGQEMKICVGTYRDVVLSKWSTIVSMRRDDQYVGCIELDKEFALKQMKGKRNSYLVGDAAKAAKKWVSLVGIKDTKYCRDFVHLGEKIDATFDYHNLELDENGNVVCVNRIANQNNRDNYFAEDYFPF